MVRPRLSLALPFYNEEENVANVIHDLENAFASEGLENYELLAVNNGSWDKTAEILKELNQKNPRVKIVTVPVNQGLGYGILQGFKAAEGDYVGFNCGDGQISAEDVMKVWRKLITGNFDLCKVKRVVRQDGLNRRFISAIFNTLCRVLFGIKSRDVNGIPKIMKREVLERLRLVSKDWFIDAEIMIKATQAGFKIGEEPVEFLKRKGGSSHVDFRALIEFFKNLLIYRFKGCPMAESVCLSEVRQ